MSTAIAITIPSELVEKARTILERIRRGEAVPVEEKREVLKQAREHLGEFIRKFWASPLGELVRKELSEAAEKSGWADFMRSLMGEQRDRMRDVAKKLGLSGRYKFAWGKEE